MDHCGVETLQPTSQFKKADGLAQLRLGVAQHCSVLVFRLQKFLCWKLRNFILRNIVLVYLTWYSFCNLFSLPLFHVCSLITAAMPLSTRNSDSHYHRCYAPTQARIVSRCGCCYVPTCARIDSHYSCLKFFSNRDILEKNKAKSVKWF